MAVDDAYQIYHDQTLTLSDPGVLGNDSYSSGQNVSAILDAVYYVGSLTSWNGGDFTFTADRGAYGTAILTYHDVDQYGQSSNEASVTIDVMESAPTASDMSYSIYHDEVLTVPPAGVLADASDPDPPDMGNVVAGLVTFPTAGTLSDYGDEPGHPHPYLLDGSFVYTPPPKFHGTVTFQFCVSDGMLRNGPYTVTIDVMENAPTASDLSYDIYHDQVLTVSPAGVLANAADVDPPDMGNLTASLISGPSEGRLSDYIDGDGVGHPLLVDGSFNYTPPPKFYGTVTFKFDVTDGILTSAPYIVTINVIENAPVGSDQTYSILHDQVLTVSPAGVLSNATDSDPPDMGNLTASLVSSPSQGKLSDFIDGNGVDHPLIVDGSFVYTPPPHWAGTVTFQFNITDGILTSGPYTATINVTDQAPVATDDQYTTGWNKGDPLALQPLIVPPAGVQRNDTDPDGETFTSTIIAQPQHGKLSDYIDGEGVDHPLLVDGSFVYTPDVGYGGTDTFQYTDSDGVMTSKPATVTITVQQVDMTIFDGQFGDAVPQDEEVSRGAYTVWNNNDTNGDGTIDGTEQTVAATDNGRSEVDLMQLTINQPNPVVSGQNYVTLSAAPGLTFWRAAPKGSPFTLFNNQAQINVLTLPMTVWVEATRGSTALRDMEVTLTYNNISDNAAVTAIWATLTRAASDPWNTATVVQEFGDMDESLQQYIGIFGGTGLTPPAPQPIGIRNAILLQFTIMPLRNGDGTWERDGVTFDATRQMQRRFYTGTPFTLDPQLSAEFPTTSELPNDDTHDDDESSAVTPAGHFYSYDIPGYNSLTAVNSQSELVYNFLEFLRVGIDSGRPHGNVVAGSRCSDYYPWYARIDVVNVNGQWQRDSSKPDSNIVGVGGPIDVSAY